MQKLIQSILESLRRIVIEPRDELDRWESAARFAHDLSVYGTRQLRRDRAPQMAGALAFRTLFGLLPVTVMGALVVRAVQGADAFNQLVAGIIESAGLDRIGVSETNEQGLGGMLLGLVEQAAQYNFNAIGWIGLAVLIYASLSLMVTIESSFNSICRAPEGRSWTKRFPMYWFILTLGPVVMGVSFLINSRVEHWIESVGAWEWILSAAGGLWSFLSLWLFLFAVYALVPNTRLKLRPAVIGAVVAAVLITVGKRVLGVYLANAVSVTQFGGSLGLIPLFMFWVYVMWLVVLFGLEVTATLQVLAGRRLEVLEAGRRPTGLLDPAVVIVAMEVVGNRFGQAAATSVSDIVDETGMPTATVRAMLGHLVEAGLLHTLDGDEMTVSLARPPEQITAAELIDVGFAMADAAHSGGRMPILERLREAQRHLASEATLTELLSPQAVVAGADQVARSE